MKDLIKKLTSVCSPSGSEGSARQMVINELDGYYSGYKIDALGNLIVILQGDAPAAEKKKVMIAAHLDEIGVIATHIDEQGFIRFTQVGVLFPAYLPSARVRFANGLIGVVGLEPGAKADQPGVFDKFFIDVGLSKEENPIKIGDVGCFVGDFIDMGKKVVSKTMDDRVSVAVAIEAIKRIGKPKNDLYFVFTTQEEVGTRGAGTAAYGVEPDLAFAIDVTVSGDTPKNKSIDVGLGKGPAIKIKDYWMIADQKIVRWMTSTAEALGIPYQREVLLLGSTDARSIQVTRSGVPAGCVSIPCRYVHSTVEMVDMDDVENAVKLIVGLLKYDIKI